MTIVGLVAPILEGCESRVTAPPGGGGTGSNKFDVSALSDGQGLLTTSKGSDGFPILIVRQSESAYVAFSSRCTHASCQVLAPAGGAMACPCHGSRFDLNGTPLSGPATTPLTKYTATYDPSTTTVTVTT